MFNLCMEVSIYSRRGVRGDGLMGLGPEGDNQRICSLSQWYRPLVSSRRSPVLAHNDWSHVSQLQALLSLCYQQVSGDHGAGVAAPDWCHVGVLVYFMSPACQTIVEHDRPQPGGR
ncbi:hypothetical protein HanHA300_Chr03g0094261 [Helianthus annuus]|nr:hypothetical protein HanHA300_Chr03g0094261 [Helianthus annuus]KAJ0608204.1 hypothetical protein HanHA89_Chr03g0105981 [Helianthus annuus]KAJ0768267.1 hypothetical protein HanLR1_Chr03g0099331 [Helianthus annuus]KAJ0774032.1 hypothetical protein HanOQP8_Chr03g0107021 [Helianthus annuus]